MGKSIPTFALIGAAGYIAPRHLEAIKAVGGNLIAALDPHDSVGILDRYFPECHFFTEFERFDRFCDKHQIDYVSVCSPNYLHDAHCKFALRIGANVICEKPLVLTEENLDFLELMEEKSGKKIYAILQLRYHPSMKNKKFDGKNEVKINYFTPRGYWYHYSWKGDLAKSGGLATNIGIHLFDLVLNKFGNYTYYALNDLCSDPAKEIIGEIYLINAKVDFKLSIKPNREPMRVFSINGEDYHFNNGFNELHTKCYEEILDGRGFGIEDVRPSIRLTESIRNAYYR